MDIPADMGHARAALPVGTGRCFRRGHCSRCHPGGCDDSLSVVGRRVGHRRFRGCWRFWRAHRKIHSPARGLYRFLSKPFGHRSGPPVQARSGRCLPVQPCGQALAERTDRRLDHRYGQQLAASQTTCVRCAGCWTAGQAGTNAGFREKAAGEIATGTDQRRLAGPPERLHLLPGQPGDPPAGFFLPAHQLANAALHRGSAAPAGATQRQNPPASGASDPASGKDRGPAADSKLRHPVEEELQPYRPALCSRIAACRSKLPAPVLFRRWGKSHGRGLRRSQPANPHPSRGKHQHSGVGRAGGAGQRQRRRAAHRLSLSVAFGWRRFPIVLHPGHLDHLSAHGRFGRCVCPGGPDAVELRTTGEP